MTDIELAFGRKRTLCIGVVSEAAKVERKGGVTLARLPCTAPSFDALIVGDRYIEYAKRARRGDCLLCSGNASIGTIAPAITVAQQRGDFLLISNTSLMAVDLPTIGIGTDAPIRTHEDTDGIGKFERITPDML